MVNRARFKRKEAVMGSAVFDDVVQANCQFAADYKPVGMAGRAARGLAILTCMDSRLEPLAMLGLAKGDAKILRNAGARFTDDLLRTLILAIHLLDVKRVMIVGHTECRMSGIDDTDIHKAIADTAGLDTRSLDFGAVQDQQSALRHDMQRIRSSPYLPASLAVIGCVFDLSTGLLTVLDPQ